MSAFLLMQPGVASINNTSLNTHFTFDISVQAKAGEPLKLWIPVASDNELQDVSSIKVTAPGASHSINVEPEYDNRMVFLQYSTAPSELKITVEYDVRRWTAGTHNVRRSKGETTRFLKSDSLVPLGGRYAEIAKEVVRGNNAMSKMHSIFEHVVATMQYDYKKESPKLGMGDVAFVCDYKRGNCSDLHSYVISLARTEGIPAYLEYGFPISGIPIPSEVPTEGEIGGYHCWTWYFDSQSGWLPLDASDGRRWLDSGFADISKTLSSTLVLQRSAVAVSKGRDITLQPKQAGGSLNHFIKPHAQQNYQQIETSWKVRYKLNN